MPVREVRQAGGAVIPEGGKILVGDQTRTGGRRSVNARVSRLHWGNILLMSTRPVTVVELSTFPRSAADAGLDDSERSALERDDIRLNQPNV
jgi:hypothetical protein